MAVQSRMVAPRKMHRRATSFMLGLMLSLCWRRHYARNGTDFVLRFIIPLKAFTYVPLTFRCSGKRDRWSWMTS